jgi:hypothetical protein
VQAMQEQHKDFPSEFSNRTVIACVSLFFLPLFISFLYQFLSLTNCWKKKKQTFTGTHAVCLQAVVPGADGHVH